MYTILADTTLLARRALLRRKLLSTFSDPRSPIRSFVGTMNRVMPVRYTDSDPCKVVQVDPNAIKWRHTGDVTHAFFGRVRGGNWDKNSERFDQTKIYRSLKRRFRDGIEWQDTTYYQEALKKVHSSDPKGPYTTESDVRARFERLDTLFESIRKEGYLSQTELLEVHPEYTREFNNDAVVPRLNEVGVYVGRDGDLIFRSRGSHRLTIAKLLDLESIPVQFSTRHKMWQQLRYEFRDRGPSALPPSVDQGHPDLRDLR